MRADIAESRRSQQRVAHRMRQHISVRMPHRPFIERQLNPADDQLPPFRQPVQVVPDAAAHAHAFARSRSKKNRASSISAGFVILMLRSDPSTT